MHDGQDGSTGAPGSPDEPGVDSGEGLNPSGEGVGPSGEAWAEGLRRTFDAGLRQSAAWRETDDPEVVLEALSMALAVALVDGLDGFDSASLRRLGTQGRRAILAAGPEGRALADEDDDLEDAGWALALARAGLATLDPARREAPREVPADPMHPPAGRITRMLQGELDGFSAGACAEHVRRCARCSAAVDALRAAESRTVPLAVAAAEADPMRDPSEGRLLATHPGTASPGTAPSAPALEAFLFESPAPRRLAIYAAASVPLRLEGEGVTTEQMLPGYWLGRVAPERNRVNAVVHVGEERLEWALEL